MIHLDYIRHHMWELRFRVLRDPAGQTALPFDEWWELSTMSYNKEAIIQSFLACGFTVNKQVPARKHGVVDIDVVFLYHNNEGALLLFLLNNSLPPQVTVEQIW